jgi:transposase
VLVELSVVEQRYPAVLAVVQDGWKVTEVAHRLGVSRQTVHTWIARYEQGGLGALSDHSHRPSSCRHELAAEIQAQICELRRERPGWGPRRIEHQLRRTALDPVPGRSSMRRIRSEAQHPGLFSGLPRSPAWLRLVHRGTRRVESAWEASVPAMRNRERAHLCFLFGVFTSVRLTDRR